ncbi:hypothetical protein FNV68_26375 [Streptomyces sp. S1D4-23]|nr:hypothetical protein FNV61_25130 [Streptomyces sp. RLB3-6]QDO09301.1 hypothetical protein FNV68_26375 [Streptomyces sp. S1D4-23]
MPHPPGPPTHLGPYHSACPAFEDEVGADAPPTPRSTAHPGPCHPARPAFEDEAVQADRGSGGGAPGGVEGAEPLGDGTGRGGGGEEPLGR